MIGVGGMLAAGVGALGRVWRVAALLAALHAGLAIGLGALIGWGLLGRHGHRPLLDRAADGDLEAILALFDGPTLAAAAALGLAVAALHLVVSWYTTAGLLGAIRGERFAAAGARGFARLARLWLVGLAPTAAAVALLGGGLAATWSSVAHAVEPADLALPLVAAAPGLVALAVVACALDYARVELIAERSALRALGRGLRRVISRPAPLVHHAAYLAAWWSLAGLALVSAPALEVAAAAVVSELLAAARTAARVAACGGQVALVAEDRPALAPHPTPILRRALP